MAANKIVYPSIDERRAMGLAARKRTPPSSHARWRPAAGRPDPVALLAEQDATRMPGLVPVRHGRMMVSPFTFYRGAAAIMTADLKDTPVAGLEAQLDNRHYYWRQLRDMKGSADVESMTPPALTFYARTCGWTLARAHARSGDPIAIAACLGDSDAFDTSITDFSRRYADQNERDYTEFVKAIRSGRLAAREGV